MEQIIKGVNVTAHQLMATKMIDHAKFIDLALVESSASFSEHELEELARVCQVISERARLIVKRRG